MNFLKKLLLKIFYKKNNGFWIRTAGIRQLPDDVSEIEAHLQTLLMRYGICRVGLKKITEIRPWLGQNGTKEKSEYISSFYQNSNVKLEFVYFFEQKTSVTIHFSTYGKREFSSWHLEAIVPGTPKENYNPSSPGLIDEYYDKFFNHEVVKEIVEGKFWFNFYMDIRDWATIPSLPKELIVDFEKAWAIRKKVVLTPPKLILFKNGKRLELVPRITKFIHVEIYKEIFVVQEDYYKSNLSNLYAVDMEGVPIWTAEMPHDSDSYVNRFKIIGDHIESSSWNGMKCKIDILNGKLLENKVSK